MTVDAGPAAFFALVAWGAWFVAYGDRPLDRDHGTYLWPAYRSGFPYRDSFDIKPPGVHFLFLGLVRAFRVDLLDVPSFWRGTQVVHLVAASWGACWIAAESGGSPWAAAAVSLLAGLPTIGATMANVESFGAPWAVWSVALAVPYPAASAALAGVAFCFCPQAGVAALAAWAVTDLVDEPASGFAFFAAPAAAALALAAGGTLRKSVREVLAYLGGQDRKKAGLDSNAFSTGALVVAVAALASAGGRTAWTHAVVAAAATSVASIASARQFQPYHFVLPVLLAAGAAEPGHVLLALFGLALLGGPVLRLWYADTWRRPESAAFRTGYVETNLPEIWREAEEAAKVVRLDVARRGYRAEDAAVLATFFDERQTLLPFGWSPFTMRQMGFPSKSPVVGRYHEPEPFLAGLKSEAPLVYVAHRKLPAVPTVAGVVVYDGAHVRVVFARERTRR